MANVNKLISISISPIKNVSSETGARECPIFSGSKSATENDPIGGYVTSENLHGLLARPTSYKSLPRIAATSIGWAKTGPLPWLVPQAHLRIAVKSTDWVEIGPLKWLIPDLLRIATTSIDWAKIGPLQWLVPQACDVSQPSRLTGQNLGLSQG